MQKRSIVEPRTRQRSLVLSSSFIPTGLNHTSMFTLIFTVYHIVYHVDKKSVCEQLSHTSSNSGRLLCNGWGKPITLWF